MPTSKKFRPPQTPVSRIAESGQGGTEYSGPDSFRGARAVVVRNGNWFRLSRTLYWHRHLDPFIEISSWLTSISKEKGYPPQIAASADVFADGADDFSQRKSCDLFQIFQTLPDPCSGVPELMLAPGSDCSFNSPVAPTCPKQNPALPLGQNKLPLTQPFAQNKLLLTHLAKT